MTVFDVLNFHRELLARLASIGFKPDDYRYIELYSEYKRMRIEGNKVTYIIALLADKYSVSERKIYSLVKRFEKDCT